MTRTDRWTPTARLWLGTAFLAGGSLRLAFAIDLGWNPARLLGAAVLVTLGAGLVADGLRRRSLGGDGGDPWPWLGIGAVVIGLAMLTGSTVADLSNWWAAAGAPVTLAGVATLARHRTG